jgi:FAD-dependent urate hydroxylase
MDQAQILIVGAGPAGLAAAHALRQVGFAPEVVERDTAWTDAGTGMYLPANGVRALRALGLDDAVTARAVHIPIQRLLDRRGRVLAEIDLAQLWGDVGPCLGIARTQLHKVLRDDVPVRFGTALRSLEQTEGEPVRATFSDGHTDEFSLVVGADGLRSTVRRLVADDRAPIPVGQHSWRLLTAGPPEVRTWTVLLGRGSSFLMLPVGGGLLYCYADVTTDAATHSELVDPVEQLRRRFSGFADPVPAILEGLHDSVVVHVAPIEEVASPRWGHGATVLIGDAAHGMSPNMAQGAALAFEDALVLAASVRRAGSVDAAVAQFVARRDKRTRWVRAQTHRRDRTRGLPAILRDPMLRHFASRIFASNYGPLLAEP